MEILTWTNAAIVWVIGYIWCYAWMYVDSARCDGDGMFNHSMEKFNLEFSDYVLFVTMWPILLLCMVYRYIRIILVHKNEMVLFGDNE